MYKTNIEFENRSPWNPDKFMGFFNSLQVHLILMNHLLPI